MSVDPSLKVKGALKRHRNVLTRAERIEKLKEEERWNEDDPIMGLPKVANRKAHTAKKGKEKLEEATEETTAVPTAEETESASS